MGTKLKVAADMATCLEYDDRPLARKCNGPTCTACAHITYLRLLRLTGLAQCADKLVGTASGTATAGVALEHGRDIVNDCLAEGAIINCTAGKVLRFIPPLIITQEQVDAVIATLDDVLAKYDK